MRDTLLNLYVKFQSLKNGEEGQDLVEYALLVALIALVCVSGVNNVASAVNTVFIEHQLVTRISSSEVIPTRNPAPQPHSCGEYGLPPGQGLSSPRRAEPL